MSVIKAFLMDLEMPHRSLSSSAEVPLHASWMSVLVPEKISSKSVVKLQRTSSLAFVIYKCKDITFDMAIEDVMSVVAIVDVMSVMVIVDVMSGMAL